MLRKDISRDLVPQNPGVYIFRSKGKRHLYIWKAKNLKKRLQQYFTPSSLRKQDMVAKAYTVEWLPTKTEDEALILEIQMIKHHLPPYNNLIKSTTWYVYIRLSKEKFPKISITRYKKNDGATYIGPKVRKKELKALMTMARYVLQRRTCNLTEYKKWIVCSDYYFGQCKWRCAYQLHQRYPNDESLVDWWFVPSMSYDEALDDSKQMLKLLRDLFMWRTNKLVEYMTQQMQHAIDGEKFERAAKLRDMVFQLQNVSQKQSIVFDADISWVYTHIEERDKYWLWVVVTIQEWRVIDVIGHHEYKEDVSKELLLVQIQNEYECEELTPSPIDEMSWYSISKKRVKKQALQDMEEHSSRFLEWYAFSRFVAQDPASRLALLQTLKEDYSLSRIPKTIECLDISHFSGEHTSGGLTGMVNGVLAKSRYKRYKISDEFAWDDYASLKEVLQRRFKNLPEKSDYPDLFVIDGGVWQLGVVTRLRQEDPSRARRTNKIIFVWMWKWKARARKWKQAWEFEVICSFAKEWTINVEPLSYNDSDKLLVKLRDEAHRFANAYRKKQASKTRER